MWYETEIHEGIDWQGVTVDGFRPRGKVLKEMLQQAGMEPGYSGFRADKAYCHYGLQIKKAFHEEAKKRGLANDDKCLTHFLVPRGEFGEDFEDIHKELKSDKSNYPSAYRIVIFQFPKNSCSAYKNCIENLLKKIEFKNKEDYRDPNGCIIDLEDITRGEIKDSIFHVLNLHIRDPPWDKFCDADYKDAWPIYHEFSYPPFEKWYLSLPKRSHNLNK
ncbi:MAG: hypothetical protein NTY20_05980 [Candidatus Aenigmarchaeota archaeon]|nr:hypothetical protein [Candidatus Aenigmarchaeota archaeon]